MSTNSDKSILQLPPQALAEASRLPGLALGRVRDEINGIWSEARELSRKEVSTETLHSDAVYAAWYAGLASMAALRMIEWRLAAMIGAVHTVERFGRRATVRELAKGLEPGI
jgi:hypothetical protein